MDSNQNGGEKLSPGGHGPINNGNVFNFLVIGIITTFIINLFIGSMHSNEKLQIEYGQFIQLVEQNTVREVRIESERIALTLKDNADPDLVKSILRVPEIKGKHLLFYTGKMEDPLLTERLISNNVAFYAPIINSNPILRFFSSWIIPFLIFYGVYYLFMSRMSARLGGGGAMGGMLNVGKSKAKVYDLQQQTEITFDDVAGQDEAKESLSEMVDFLHSPEKYQAIGAKQPKGALLVGPPGTGKTLLARAMAGEAKVPFFSLSGSEFVEMYVGVGASRVRDLFEQAATHAPCIIFIDEIDAIGKSRDAHLGNDEREQTLNQLLSEMDGFDSSKGIVVLGATNRPETLDKALLRPGRFDRQVLVEKPDLLGREGILAVHAKKVVLDDSVDLREIALATSGATGADLANMVNEGALRAVRMGRTAVNQEDLAEAVESVIAGKEKKDRILSGREKRIVAFHEVGHALASALQKDAPPVQKISIVPRTMGALGYTMNVPEEERYLMTRSELMAQIVTLLAGRAAEEVEFHELSTGAANDIERATKLARSMVTLYGMSDRFGMMNLETQENRYLDGRFVSAMSDTTSAEVDKEVGSILTECYATARALIADNRDKMAEIADFLIQRETITGGQFMEIVKAQAVA